jgi:hypothetical protein
MFDSDVKQRGVEMDADDGWPQVWDAKSYEELRERIEDYLWLSAKGRIPCRTHCATRGRSRET